MADEVIGGLRIGKLPLLDVSKPQTPMTHNIQARPMSPEQALLLGGAADALSTWKFLHDGSRTEQNVVMAKLASHPALAGATAYGSTIAAALLARALKKKFPDKGAKIANLLEGNFGATQLGYGAMNIADYPTGSSASAEYQQRLQRNASR
jgi:hypothetical protein